MKAERGGGRGGEVTERMRWGKRERYDDREI